MSAELAPGAVVRGVRHEDLQRTSFADNTFDLVISSEARPACPCLAPPLARSWRWLSLPVQTWRLAHRCMQLHCLRVLLLLPRPRAPCARR